MNGYEKLIKQMRTQGAYKNEKGVFLATMEGYTSCRIGELVLEREDLLIAEHLMTGYVASNGDRKQGIKNGDLVLVKKLSDTKYAIIEKVI